MSAAFLLLMIAPLSAQELNIRVCEDSPESFDALWAKARTVRIETASATGTGAVVSPDGFVVTAAHIITAPDDISVVFEDGRSLPARLSKVSGTSDLALLSVEARDLPCFQVEPEPIDVGTEVLVIGSPGGEALTHSVSKGIVSAYRDMDGTTLIQTDASINPGNSGGPMVDPNGRLLGVVSFKVAGPHVEGLGFSVAATNFGEDLSLAFVAETEAAAFEVLADDSATERFLAIPTVEPGPGVTIDTDVRYELKYRPKWAGAVASLVIVGVGLGDVALQRNLLANDKDMMGLPLNDDEELMHLGLQVLGWGGAAGGALLFGLSFKPAAKGEILTIGRNEP